MQTYVKNSKKIVLLKIIYIYETLSEYGTLSEYFDNRPNMF